jgi:hypothetical protein
VGTIPKGKYHWECPRTLWKRRVYLITSND